MNPQYPVYIPSKGRWEKRHTARHLDQMGVPYHIVIVAEEFEQYAEVIDPSKILVLPEDQSDNLVQSRNWIWDHAQASGAARHWQLDDNMDGFYRMTGNRKIRVGDGTIFRAAEDFVDRYENVPHAGFQYEPLAPRKSKHPPFLLNTRIYSCHLLDNALDMRFRGVYNDDTDLSLRILKAGYCTILFYAFLCKKLATMTVAGGNTEDLYLIKHGRLKMARSLVEQHPDVTTIAWKWGRWQHLVDYTRFRNNKLVLKPGLRIKKGVDEYGMKVVELS